MEYPLIVLGTAVSACASQSSPDLQSVGQSQLAPKPVAQCVAVKWANNSGQTVYLQYMLANEQAFDVYVPGQQPLGGASAIVRRSTSGPGSSVGLRGVDSNAASTVS